MTRYRRSLWLLFPLTAPVAACQSVAKTEMRTLDPIITANALPGLAPGAPSLGNGRIRIADLAVTPGKTDFCIKLSSSSNWGYPIMANYGTDTFFRGGLAYPQVTVPFSAPVGTIDVKFVTAGDTCSGTTLCEATNIPVGNAAGDGGASAGGSPVVTILRYGGNTGAAGDPGVPESVAWLPEETNVNPTCPSDDCPRIRVVHAAATANVISFGQTANNARALPATILSEMITAPIPPGHAMAPGTTLPPLLPSDSSGYAGAVTTGVAGQSGLTLGIVSYPASAPSTTASAIFQPESTASTETLYFIGDPNNNIHPLQGLLVDDLAASARTDGGIDTQFLASAVLTTPATVTIDTVNTALYGLTSPNADVRRGPIAAALAARQSDVICLAETDYDTDKQLFAQQAANGHFPYSYWVPTTLVDGPTNAKDWYGNTPPVLSTAACAAEQQNGQLAAVVTCASACSASGGNDPDASITSTACLEDNCFSALGVIVQHPACLDCLLEYLPSGYPIDQAVAECGTDSNDPYGQFNWGGQNGSVILSHYPFAKLADGVTDDTEAFILPSSNFHRIVLRARLQLDPSSQMDVYCAQFVSPDTGSGVFQYAGPYATPDAGLYSTENSTDNGWRDEDSLEARDTIQWIQSQSGTTPALIAGDWHSHSGYTTDAGVLVLEPHVPEVFAQFIDAGFIPAHPAGYTYACEICNDNPYNAAPVTTDGTTGFDFTTTFMLNLDPHATLSDTLWDTNPAAWVVVLPTGDGGTSPLSPDYPRSVQILRP